MQLSFHLWRKKRNLRFSPEVSILFPLRLPGLALGLCRGLGGGLYPLGGVDGLDHAKEAKSLGETGIEVEPNPAGLEQPEEENPAVADGTYTVEVESDSSMFRVVKCELDRDDGRYVYEVELREGRTEYECDVNAVTGVILKWEVDYD